MRREGSMRRGGGKGSSGCEEVGEGSIRKEGGRRDSKRFRKDIDLTLISFHGECQRGLIV